MGFPSEYCYGHFDYKIVVEETVEGRNAIRYPSQQYIEETFHSPCATKQTKYKVDILYDNCKFL